MAFHSPRYGDSGNELTTQEEAFVQNLASEASYDSSQVALQSDLWVYDVTPTGTVDGSNTVFTLPANASQVVVVADGLRVKGSGADYTFNGTDTITFASGRQPYSSISVDYKPA